MGDEHAVVALCELQRLFIKWCQIPADQMKYEPRDPLVTIIPRILTESQWPHQAYQDDPCCELTLDTEKLSQHNDRELPSTLTMWARDQGRAKYRFSLFELLATLIVGCQVSSDLGMSGPSLHRSGSAITGSDHWQRREWSYSCDTREREGVREQSADPSRAGHNNFIQPGQQTQPRTRRNLQIHRNF